MLEFLNYLNERVLILANENDLKLSTLQGHNGIGQLVFDSDMEFA